MASRGAQKNLEIKVSEVVIEYLKGKKVNLKKTIQAKASHPGFNFTGKIQVSLATTLLYKALSGLESTKAELAKQVIALLLKNREFTTHLADVNPEELEPEEKNSIKEIFKMAVLNNAKKTKKNLQENRNIKQKELLVELIDKLISDFETALIARDTLLIANLCKKQILRRYLKRTTEPATVNDEEKSIWG